MTAKRLLTLFLGIISPVIMAQPGNDLFENPPELSDYADLYLTHCAVCHGDKMQGTPQGVSLMGPLQHGDSVAQIGANIGKGFPTRGMPAWSETLSAKDIKTTAMYIAETRLQLDYKDFQYNAPIAVPSDVQPSELHSFRIEVLIDDLDPQPFSIATLPDGSLLLVEKKYGMRLISPDGVKSEYIRDTPRAFDDTYILAVDQEWGNGWLLEAAPHPNYSENGWIYLQYGDRCEGCNAISRNSDGPVSMNKLVRGRIRDGAWVDEEVIWSTDVAFYGSVTDVAAGGRIAFDRTGHVFISVGMKGFDNHTGVQDLGIPWGKIFRINDDGSIPIDNPFIATPGAIKSIWTYGHRSPQGLEYRYTTGQLWGTEHGPRGGDEINLLKPGKNYGWPLTSLGVNYNGSAVDYGRELGIEFDLKEIEQPVVDLSPSPAVSSFIFYDGEAFPAWQGDMLVGSLKAQSLYRVRLEGDRAVHRETLIQGLARIRDIEMGNQGQIYLLLENNAGSMIVALWPAPLSRTAAVH